MKLFILYLLWVSVVQMTVAFTQYDHNSNCADWAEAGECEANPTYMLSNCAKSCERVEKESSQVDQKLANISSFFDLAANDIDGNRVQFEEFRGKVTILTNVASYCGYTESHYRGLVELWSNIQNENVEVLAFPCNQFGKQEPGTADEIKKFAASKGVHFRMMEKIDVNGVQAHQVYLYLKREGKVSSIRWNFATYFVVGPDGSVQAYNGVEPMDLMEAVFQLLGKEEL